MLDSYVDNLVSLATTQASSLKVNFRGIFEVEVIFIASTTKRSQRPKTSSQNEYFSINKYGHHGDIRAMASANIIHPNKLFLDHIATGNSNNQDEVMLHTNASVLSISFYNKAGSKMSVPVKFTLSLKNDLSEINFQSGTENISRNCVFYDKHIKAWSSYGCKSVIYNATSITCFCNHTTTFAALLEVRKSQSLPILEAVTAAFEIL